MRIIRTILLLTTVWVGSISGSPCFGQAKPLIGQYFQNLPAFAPALTGANEFLDLRFAVREQWVGFEGAPKTLYFSAYGAIKSNIADNYRTRSLRLGASGVEAPKPKTKHGLGGFMQSDKQGAYNHFDLNINYSAHVPISESAFISMGVSLGFSTDKVDISDVNVKNRLDDATYQSYLRNGLSSTYFDLIAGVAINSDHYYLSYSALPLVHAFLGGNEENHHYGATIRHQLMAGGRIYLGQDIELIPNAYARKDLVMPLLYDAGLRVRYLQQYWAGLSYRSTDTVIGMLGFVINDIWKFSYSYEYGFGEFSAYHNGTHEIVLGIQLFNYKKYSSMW